MALRRWMVLLAVVALALGACGGDDETEPTGEAVQDAAEDAVEDAVDDAVEEGVEDALGELSDEDCAEIGLALASAASLGAAADPNSSGDIEDTIESFDRMVDAAPEELRADFEVLATAYRQFFTDLEEAGIDLADPSTYSSPQDAQKFAEIGEEFQSSGFQKASENISNGLTELCAGFEP